ncbi:phage terminase small subunit P27 family [Clostridium tyrobutyricum]|nr:phage terminase small subunit P27 family [Clostridium tyrobutyricum]MBV4417195.1 phage terminase small subunit P27 family [Clostridium tyrobutyricum]
MSVKSILENGNRSHLTKDEIEKRQQQEKALEKLQSNKIRPPTWMSKMGKKIFKDIVKNLKEIDILVNVDVYGLAICSDAMDKYIRCTIALHTENLRKEQISEVGIREVENPLVKTQIRYAEIFKKYSSDFGLSPAARLKIVQANTPELDEDEQKCEEDFGDV